MRRKGFTLLELVVVIIIVGILATLGVTQYSSFVEKSRGAEAKAILGDIRKFAAAYYMQYKNLTSFTLPSGIPSGKTGTCSGASHYFQYSIDITNSPEIAILATRCGTDGKPPTGVLTNTLTLTSVLDTGVDTWTGYYSQ